MRVVTVNGGSSSLRLSAVQVRGERVTTSARVQISGGPERHAEALGRFLGEHGEGADVIAHRLVHGGNRITGPALVDAALERTVDDLAQLAPLHNPAALNLIRVCKKRVGPDFRQVVIPDTAFYSGLPQVAADYALPRTLCERAGIRRFGFHGLAHRAMLERLIALRPDLPAGGRVISLQLGAGCSITAVREGQPMDTSMGFTPMEGLVMSTRCGDVDAGLLFYLKRKFLYCDESLEQLLNHESGLLGVSGFSGDMRELLESGTAAAERAIALYCYRARKYIGAYLAVLGGADAILFGGGVGENSAPIRSRILSGMEWVGLRLDPERNAAAAGVEARISTEGAAMESWVIPVDENEILARDAVRLVRGRHA